MSIEQSYNQILEWWISKKIKESTQLTTILNNYNILFAYHSGNIENDQIQYYQTREIFENGKIIGFTGDLRTIYEIQNMKHCRDYIYSIYDAKQPITLDIIKKVNYELCKYTLDEQRYVVNGESAGELKKHDYVIGLNDSGSSAENTKYDLQELLDELYEHTFKSIDTLTKAAYFHARFENIHPFSDGNGRTGRTLLNYYLLTQNHPPLIIYTEDKMAYYSALESYDQDETIEPLKKFLKVETIKTWSNHVLRK